MEYSLGSTPKIQQPPNKSHRAKAMQRVVGASANTNVGGSNNGVNGNSNNSVLAKNSGVCPKCNCKRRHSRTCPFKKKGDDEDDMMDMQASNASSLFGYLDLVALKRYTKHYRLKTKHNSSKAELANAVKLHFESTHVNEGEVIDIFLMKVKTTGSPQSS